MEYSCQPYNEGQFSLTATKPKAWSRPVRAGFGRNGKTLPVVARYDQDSPRGLTSKTATNCSPRGSPPICRTRPKQHWREGAGSGRKAANPNNHMLNKANGAC